MPPSLTVCPTGSRTVIGPMTSYRPAWPSEEWRWMTTTRWTKSPPAGTSEQYRRAEQLLGAAMGSQGPVDAHRRGGADQPDDLGAGAASTCSGRRSDHADEQLAVPADRGSAQSRRVVLVADQLGPEIPPGSPEYIW